MKELKYFLSVLLAGMLVTGGCIKDKSLPLATLPIGIKNFLKTYYPDKKIISSRYKDGTPNNYNVQSFNVTIPAGGGAVPVVSSGTTFNYGNGGSNINLFKGIYIITLEQNIVLEFTDGGFFIRQVR